MPEKPVKPSHVGCAFCDWRTPRFRTLKSGKVKGPEAAYSRLRHHVSWAHPDLFEKICEPEKE